MFRKELRFIPLLLIVFVLTSVIVPAFAQSEASVPQVRNTFTVNTTVDAIDANIGDGNCSTAAGKCSIRAAIMEANSLGSATINVPAGNYALTLTTGASDEAFGDLDIYVPVTITGAGASQTTIRQTVNTGLERVINIEGAITVQISDLTITGGNAEGPEDDTLSDGGGGIEVLSGATVTLSGLIVKDNNARFGGGLRCDNSTLTINNSSLTNNTSGQSSGGLDVYLCNATVLDSLFSQNTAVEWGGAAGGYEASLTVLRSTFQDNSAAYGGAIAINTGSQDITLSLTSSRFYRNSASSSGGAVYAISYGAVYTVTITDVLFEDNQTVERGGAVQVNNLSLTVNRSAFLNNRAWEGGGLSSFSSAVSVTNSTFIGNYAVNGAAVRGENTITLNHVTIVNNHSVLGGAVTSYDVSNPTLIENSIIAGNTAARYFSPECVGDFVSNGANFLGNWWCTSEASDMFGDPNLASVAVPADSGLPALTPNMGSVVINAGLAGDCAPLDQTGRPRNDGQCDIGALEAGGFTNMIRNGGFENGMTDWKTANLSGDKRVCDNIAKNKYPALTLSCSFQFSNPTGSLTQNIPATLLPNPGGGFSSIVRLAATVSSSASGMYPVVSVKFNDAGGNVSTTTLAVSMTQGVGRVFSEGCVDFTPTKGKVTVKFTASKGKLTVDDLSLIEAFTIPGTCPTRSQAAPTIRDGSAPLGLPAAPDGFRGNN